MLAYGPYHSLSPGSYVARFHLAAKGDAPVQRVAILDVQTDVPALFTVLAQRELRIGDLPTGGGYATIELPFTVSQPARIETRVQYQGETELWLGSIDVIRTAQPGSLEQQFPSWPRTALWVIGTVVVGTLLAAAARQPGGGQATLNQQRAGQVRAQHPRRAHRSERPPLPRSMERQRPR
jgi:hypothetical protein